MLVVLVCLRKSRRFEEQLLQGGDLKQGSEANDLYVYFFLFANRHRLIGSRDSFLARLLADLKEANISSRIATEGCERVEISLGPGR